LPQNGASICTIPFPLVRFPPILVDDVVLVWLIDESEPEFAPSNFPSSFSFIFSILSFLSILFFFKILRHDGVRLNLLLSINFWQNKKGESRPWERGCKKGSYKYFLSLHIARERLAVGQWGNDVEDGLHTKCVMQKCNCIRQNCARRFL
jgi:hypothetical protein